MVYDGWAESKYKKSSLFSSKNIKKNVYSSTLLMGMENKIPYAD